MTKDERHATQEENGAPEAEIAGERATSMFEERVLAYRRDIERRRFAGQSPQIRPRRGPIEAAAAAIAAERVRGVVLMNGEAISPTEDLAADELEGALRAIALWDFSLARRHLEAAIDYARLPLLQQEISLARGLLQIARAVVYTEPGGKWSGADQAVANLLDTLDRVPADKKQFYRDEVRRLRQVWSEAVDDETVWLAWALARTRASSREGSREAELAWLLRIYRRTEGHLPPNGLLATLVERGEAFFRLLLAGSGDDEREALVAQAENAWPRDVLPVLVSALDAAFDADVLQISNRFALMIYRTPSSNTRRTS